MEDNQEPVIPWLMKRWKERKIMKKEREIRELELEIEKVKLTNKLN